ncbi:transmembrane glucosamine N-acetyltransferase NagX [Ferrimonas marina]|uniref:Predicted acyltransferase n=1 Tax=Ferrimonas marina TaxID=299255 RepID=A0A1M5YCU5_9GAMM|nr:DUF5009 domain-containing protein [Ferrimonas marina]SHI09658.1 Predicted acyltransferase [Ferrimonas marina]
MSQTPRLQAIDALRGFDMFWILGGERLFAALLLLTGWQGFALADAQMRHTPWHGFTFYDLIFPLFIFLSGVTLGLRPKYLPQLPAEQRRSHYRKAVKRLLLLLGLGVLYNHGWGGGMPMAVDQIRFASVLGRIGMAWFIAAMIVWHLRPRAQLWAAAGLALAYALLQGLWPTPDPYSAAGSANAWLDQALLPGITYQNAPLDPEGLLSHLSAALNALAGVWAGRWLTQSRSLSQRGWGLVLAGALCLALGWGMHPWIPVNKTLWTVSFVAVTLGWSLWLLALFLLLVDGWQWRWFGGLFALIGVNSIAIYLLSAWVNWDYTSLSLFGGVVAALPEPAQPLLAVIALLACQWALLAFMARRQIFIKV